MQRKQHGDEIDDDEKEAALVWEKVMDNKVHVFVEPPNTSHCECPLTCGVRALTLVLLQFSSWRILAQTSTLTPSSNLPSRPWLGLRRARRSLSRQRTL